MSARKSLQGSDLRALSCLIGFLTLIHPASPTVAADASAIATGDAAERDELREEQRRQLTEREDKLRPAQPWQVDIAGRPLTVSGEVGFDFERLHRAAPGSATRQRDRLMQLALEVEAFYSVDATFATFAQLRLAHEELRRAGAQRASTRYVERGEMWLYGKSVAGSQLNLELGRLKFEDDRRWWWDQELDAARLSYESSGVEIALAFARELGRSRSDRSTVEPEHDRVSRWFAQATWDWAPAQALNVFALRHNDRSAPESTGQIIPFLRLDDSDARLTWLGVGAAGEVKLRTRGVLSYHVDAASVRGDERLNVFDPLSAQASVVSSVSRRTVRGWALDAGLRWTAASALMPRGFLGYAFGSGSATAGGADRSFRQTGLHANEAGFGGVKRFAHYGAALDPELSNLRIATVGAGLSPTAASSLDLVYHRYRQVSPATSMRAARIATELTGIDRDIGTGLDLVAAIEAWERVELSAIASSFRSGAAFGQQAGRTHTFGALGIRVAF